MGGLVNALAQRVEVDMLDARLEADLGGGFQRHEANRGLSARQGSLVVEPALHQVLVAEHGPQLVGAVHVFEDEGVDGV